MSAVFGGAAWLGTPETFEPVLLQRKGRRLRMEKRKWALHAKIEENPIDGKMLLEKYMMKPLKMIVLEPILIVVTIYIAIVYG